MLSRPCFPPIPDPSSNPNPCPDPILNESTNLPQTFWQTNTYHVPRPPSRRPTYSLQFHKLPSKTTSRIPPHPRHIAGLSLLNPPTKTGRGVRVVLRRQVFQEALLLSGVLQRAHPRKTEVWCRRLEHTLRVDELGPEGGHDAGVRVCVRLCACTHDLASVGYRIETNDASKYIRTLDGPV